MRLLVYNEELHYDERHYTGEDRIVSPFVTGSFFKGLERTLDIEYMSPVSHGERPLPPNHSSSIPRERFHPLPYWTSVPSFASFYVRPANRRRLHDSFRRTISGFDMVWNRQPAYGGIVLAEFALQAGIPVLLHIAGDIAQAWRHRGTLA